MLVFDFVMKTWDNSVRSIMPPRATDKTRVLVEGYDSDRVLIIGDGAAVGWGVDSHDDGLLGTLARELSALSGRGATVDLVADPHMTAERAVHAVRDLLVWRYDYIFIALGVSDATKLTPVHHWRHSMAALLAAITAEIAVSAHVVVASVPPISSIKQITWPFSGVVARRADALDEATIELCERLQQVRYVEMPATNVLAMKNTYEVVGATLAAALARVMNDEQHLEEARRRPVGDAAVSAHDTLARVATLVRLTFLIENAVVTVLEGNRQLRIDAEGNCLEEAEGTGVLMAFSARPADLVIVSDTRYDKRFSHGPSAAGERRIRFYASFPIESPQGMLLGNLCVTDTAPRRRRSEVDAVSLRMLAQLALRELWQYLPAKEELSSSGLL